MISIILAIMLALIGEVRLLNPSSSFTSAGARKYRNFYTTWIILSLGFGIVAGIAEIYMYFHII